MKNDSYDYYKKHGKVFPLSKYVQYLKLKSDLADILKRRLKAYGRIS